MNISRIYRFVIRILLSEIRLVGGDYLRNNFNCRFDNNEIEEKFLVLQELSKNVGDSKSCKKTVVEIFKWTAKCDIQLQLGIEDKQ